ncbi:DM13 domain-containing protein [Streptomyces sp. JJ36]|uniref:DM13 domain-containing protein n=1 Tax=Streptomyces sp. JJ36 TaxID=2736645 RepID=UPI001F44EB5D|nr:DM13 domain-containing protein [Streptomyces sp. JJ36]MCF6526057.1 DM13 domain-containing protein [Streptomyces sp. JJ36]
MIRRLLRSPLVIGALVLGLIAVGTGLYWFQPWKLWVDETVNESLPTPTAAAERQPEQPAGTPAASPDAGTPSPPPGPRTVADGELITHEHATSGTVKVVELADGSRVLRLEGLETSNGPDLKVWITDAPVKPGKAGWHVFDDGKYENLGDLKGNRGDQNYPLPDDLDLDTYTSVSIWCERFGVSFGAAELAATQA